MKVSVRRAPVGSLPSSCTTGFGSPIGPSRSGRGAESGAWGRVHRSDRRQFFRASILMSVMTTRPPGLTLKALADHHVQIASPAGSSLPLARSVRPLCPRGKGRMAKPCSDCSARMSSRRRFRVQLGFGQFHVGGLNLRILPVDRARWLSGGSLPLVSMVMTWAAAGRRPAAQREHMTLPA